MKFTKGLFLGTALGMSAAMMMNNKSKNHQASENTATNSDHPSGLALNTETQTEDYITNDII